jgi:hypothetical protein
LVRRYVAEGHSNGLEVAYLAFIQFMRWNASLVSVETHGFVPPFRRPMHLLSRSEWLLALLLSWISCHVREQMPMWPWTRANALYGYHPALDPDLKWSSGTLELCKAAGVHHGCFVGTSIPYIWTMDLVAPLAWLPPERVSAALISVKPLNSDQYTGDVDPVSRGPEKLEVERRYAKELGFAYFVADRSLYPGALLGQLELFISAAHLPRSQNQEISVLLGLKPGAIGSVIDLRFSHAERAPQELTDSKEVTLPAQPV